MSDGGAAPAIVEGLPPSLLADARPRSILPDITADIWAFAHLLGFWSNGCTASPDAFILGGARIAHGDGTWPPLPCDLHDLRYWMSDGSPLQHAAADCEFYLNMLSIALAEESRVMRVLYESQAWEYLRAVRHVGGSSWKDDHRTAPRIWG